MEKMVYWCFEASQLPVCIHIMLTLSTDTSASAMLSQCSTDCVDGWVHYCRAPRSMSSCSRTCARSVIGCHLIVFISGNKYICKTNKQKYLPPDNFLMIRKEAGPLHAADKLVKCRCRWSARFLWDRRLPEVLSWGSTLRAEEWCIHSKHRATRSSCSLFHMHHSWGMGSQTELQQQIWFVEMKVYHYRSACYMSHISGASISTYTCTHTHENCITANTISVASGRKATSWYGGTYV